MPDTFFSMMPDGTVEAVRVFTGPTPPVLPGFRRVIYGVGYAVELEMVYPPPVKSGPPRLEERS